MRYSASEKLEIIQLVENSHLSARRAAKRGLSAALHTGDPALKPLPEYFLQRLRPALASLLDAAAAAGEIRADVDPDDLLVAVRNLSHSAPDDDLTQARRMVALLVDGLRYQPPDGQRAT